MKQRLRVTARVRTSSRAQASGLASEQDCAAAVRSQPPRGQSRSRGGKSQPRRALATGAVLVFRAASPDLSLGREIEEMDTWPWATGVSYSPVRTVQLPDLPSPLCPQPDAVCAGSPSPRPSGLLDCPGWLSPSSGAGAERTSRVLPWLPGRPRRAETRRGDCLEAQVEPQLPSPALGSCSWWLPSTVDR